MKQTIAKPWVTVLLLLIAMAWPVLRSLAEASAASSARSSLNLAGDWQFRLDREDRGVTDKWFLKELPQTIRLPGSTDEQGFGDKATRGERGRLTREFSYVGAAWYRRTVDIPQDWAGKRITLFLERCHWETQVWVDGEPAGMRNSLSVPHIYDLTAWLKPGRHTLALRVDNRLKINVCHTFGNMNWAHSVTDETQSNWNGIIGRIALEASDPVGLESIQVFPDLKRNQLKLKAVLFNRTGSPAEGRLALTTEPECGAVRDHKVSLGGGQTRIEVPLPVQNGRRWDEFSPNTYRLRATLITTSGPATFKHEREVRFGLREMGQSNLRLTLNGRVLYLRGNLECCIFPLTGYPPMDLGGWKRVLGVARDYGLNHLRFHSWCPPEAAFEAADELGFLLQVEAPVWDGYGVLGRDADRATWVLEEVDRILDTYGNHPSFCLMSMGNEWGDGKDYYLRYLVEFARNKDPRRLYSATTHPSVPGRNDDYFDTAATDLGPLRGLGPFENNRPSTLHDFRAALAGQDRAYLVHEMGQPCNYPDYSQIAKYTGHLKPRNLEAFRQSLDEHHMLDQDRDFARASGRLAAAIYKEQIEANLRTPGLSGFQLLGLQDFPGQGTALVGLLDAFWDSKGILAPEEWREFCSPTVPLARMRNFVWTDDQPFAAQAEVAHYGAEDLKQARVTWSIADARGKPLAGGAFGPLELKTGGATPLGPIHFDWKQLAAPARLTLTLRVEGTPAKNHWNLWVYPAAPAEVAPEGVLTAGEWNADTKAALAKGRRVLLLPPQGSLKSAEPGQWQPVGWCYQLFQNQKKTMGILCDPAHPALAGFPTEFFGDWQWFDLLERADAIYLDAIPASYRPIVQFIHDYNLNNKLGALFEARVGPGRLLVCSLNLSDDLENRPEARQLRRSLYQYLKSEQFNPGASLDEATLDKLLARRVSRHAAAAPKDTSAARLHVKAARKLAAMNTAAPWGQAADLIEARAEGFDYQVQGGCWRDAAGAAWHAPHLAVALKCPRGFTGTLYVHFHDWNGQGRDAHVFYDGRDLGLIGRHDGPGTWLKLPVTQANSEDGLLTIDAQAMSGPNVMLTELALLPE
jgi:hypothetical protein